MRTGCIAALGTALVLVGMPACGKKGATDPGGKNRIYRDVETAAGPAAPAPLDPRLFGSWVSEPIPEEKGSVVTTFTFQEDGSFSVAYDREGTDRDKSKKGTWSATGSILSLKAAGDLPDTLVIESVDGDVLTLKSRHGSAGRFTRQKRMK